MARNKLKMERVIVVNRMAGPVVQNERDGHIIGIVNDIARGLRGPACPNLSNGRDLPKIRNAVIDKLLSVGFGRVSSQPIEHGMNEHYPSLIPSPAA